MFTDKSHIKSENLTYVVLEITHFKRADSILVILDFVQKRKEVWNSEMKRVITRPIASKK